MRSKDETVLDVKDLSKVYRPKRRGGQEVRANIGLSLRLHKGEVVAVLGPNGAGKSTFLRQVAGQLVPTSGSIRVAGIDVLAEPLRAKQRMSVIPQECQPYDSLTVEEHVRYFGVIKGMPPRGSREATVRLLEEVGLLEHRRKLIRELSGGLKRRVLIALALSTPESDLLLLDEPTTGVDPASRRAVWKLIDSLADRGKGVLLTTHYVEEAEYLADRVVIIAQGRILAEGTPNEIGARSAARGRLDVYDLDRLAPAVRDEVQKLPSDWSRTLQREDHLRLAVPDPFSAEAIACLRHLTDLGVKASLAPASLEDAYLEIAGEGVET